MKKVLKNGVIHIQNDSAAALLSKLGIAISVILIVLGAIGLVVLQPEVDKSQDLRQQASVSQGRVLVSATPVGTLRQGQPATVNLAVNTQNIQIDGVQLVFNVIGPAGSTINVTGVTQSGLQVAYSEVEQTVDGYLVGLIVVPQTIGSSFGSSSPTTFAQLTFTPNQAGQVRLAFDQGSSLSTVHNSNPPQDDLRTLSDVTLTIEGLAASPSPSPSVSPSPSPSVSPTPGVSPSPTPSVSPSPSPSVSPTPTVSPSPSATPNPNKHSLNLKTSDVFLSATDAYVVVNGRRFVFNTSDLRISSDPQSSSSDTNVTLELTWTENGIPMRMNFYFTREGSNWRLTELRVYNGNATNPDWIYSNGQHQGQVVSAQLGQRYSVSSARFTTSQNGVAEIFFENLQLEAFLRNSSFVGGYSYKSCNESCSSNSECGPNHRCYENRCRLVTNLSSTTCANQQDQGLNRSCNQYCADSRECGAGYTCFYNRCRRPENPDSATCAVTSQSVQQTIVLGCNKTCGSNRDCGVNLRCYNGSCRHATNPGSSTCTAATQPTVSTLYQNKGGTKGEDLTGGDTDTDTNAGTTASPSPSASPKGVVIASPQPEGAESSPFPSSSPIARISQFFQSNGTSAPVLAIGTGLGLLLLIILFFILSSLFRRRNDNRPPVATKKLGGTSEYEKNLQQKIDALKNGPSAGVSTPNSPINRPITPQTPVSTRPVNSPVIPRPVVTPPTPSANSSATPSQFGTPLSRPSTPPVTPAVSAAPLTPVARPATPSPVAAPMTTPAMKPVSAPTQSAPAVPAKPDVSSSVSRAPQSSMLQRIREKGIAPPGDKTS